ncbi:MAG: hypothetical protein M1839_002169 [Geoglossum umbratile]|nr:MAG: hypothetical protein M1839_002169 [Geoglossum umbratile]
MVRLGGKSNARTKALSLRGQKSDFRVNRDAWKMINELKAEAARLATRLSSVFDSYLTAAVWNQDLMEYLESDDSGFYDAFAIPDNQDGPTMIGRKGRQRCQRGLGRHLGDVSPSAKGGSRNIGAEILEQQTSQVCSIAEEYNRCVSKIDQIFNQKDPHVLSSKRTIACTTSGAAKYAKSKQHRPTKQLILIGDHKQLRPKYANYTLSIEKGDGFDFNRSMMRPEISPLVRQLTYPELVDARSTKGRPDLRGFQSNVIFVNHGHPEDDNTRLNQNDPRGSPKQNRYEAEVILNCISQNGYGSEEIVVLTPYLAQLHLLRNILSKKNNPILNDLDSGDLVRAGLMPAAAARLSRRPLHISSIDNYQGEERDFVLVSMTRSNTTRDIGFVFSPDRLNVLLSRARNSIIMIGNAETFLNARDGKDIWAKFLNLLKLGGQIHDEFPVRYERHKHRKSILRQSEDFDES